MTEKLYCPRPMGDRVIVERCKTPDQIGSLYVPERAKEFENRGVVRAVGPKVKGDIKVDDIVVFNKFEGVDVDHFGFEILFLKEEMVLAVIEVEL